MYKLGYDKVAAPRWAKMLAAGKLSPAAVERLKGMKGLKPRQIGKAPLAEGVEKVVHRGFAGDDVGPAVIKRIKNELLPGSTAEYLDLATKHPDLFNAPIAIHEGGKGWTEKALSAFPPGEKPTTVDDLFGFGAMFRKKTELPKGIRDQLENVKTVDQFVRPALGDPAMLGFNPSGEIGGKRIYDLHAGNVMYDEVGNPKIVDALVASPRVRARQLIQKYGPAALSAGLIGGGAAVGTATADKEEDKLKRGLSGAGLGLSGSVVGIPHILSGLLGRRIAPVKL